MTTRDFERRYETLRGMVHRELASLAGRGEPAELRDACRYVLAGGGKRVRAVLVLLAAESFGGSARHALHGAAAVEVLHNFTLVHDDIMDNATERRGRQTPHLRWNLNTALLAGDVLIGIGYRALLRSNPQGADAAVRVFTDALIEVCEGQALDLAFEARSRVTPAQYFRMIDKKTASLLAASAEIGGILGGADARGRATLRRFGRELGIAFQLQDDLLDVVADERDLGKPVGGDIIERKKTYLLLRALERSQGNDREFLRRVIDVRTDTASLFPREPGDGASARQQLIRATTAIYVRTGVLDDAREQVRKRTDLALRALRALPKSRARDMLGWLAGRLLHRAF